MSWKDSKVHLLVPSLPLGEHANVLPAKKEPWRRGEAPMDRIMPPPPVPPKVPSSGLPAATVSSTSSEAPPDITTESNSIEFDGNDQVLCRVCGDKASGFHYGVHSCEGCKGFFRRSIQQKIQYRPCTKNQQCNILRINRNRCQYCRLKKCIAAGMSRDAVRFGRVPKREKAKILAAMQSSRMKTQEAKVLTEMSDDSKIIEEIVRAHYDNCDYTRNKMEPFLARAKENPVYVPCSGMTCPMKGRPEDSFLDQFSERFMDHVRQVCTFAKRIPGFECLHNDDKVTLLKSCVFEVLLVRLSGLFDNQSLVCLNGDIVRKETINQMPAGNAKFLMDSVFELAQRLNQFNLSDAEIGIFCAVVIITPDRPGLRNPELVQKMQSKLKNVLNNILIPQHSDTPGIFSELLSMVHDLRTLNTLHTEKFLQQCKINGSELGCPEGGSSLQKHLLYGGSKGQSLIQSNGHHVWGGSTLDRESLGGGSPHSSSDAASEHDRRSPIGSVSSSESGCSSEVSRLTVQDLKVNNSVLLNALASAGSSRKRLVSSSEVPGEPDLLQAGGGATSSHPPPPVPRTPSSTAASAAKCPFKSRKLDSPSDSGIDSPKNIAGTSICSSPRSSSIEEDKASSHKEEEARRSPVGSLASSPEEQHPLLKRALQQPPQAYSVPSLSSSSSTNSSCISGNNNTISHFQDEVYKPHKKFRRYNLSTNSSNSEDCYPSSSSPSSSSSSTTTTSILASTLLCGGEAGGKGGGRGGPHTSLLASTLSKAAPLASDQCKRNEMLASLILERQYYPPPSGGNTVPPPPPAVPSLRRSPTGLPGGSVVLLAPPPEQNSSSSSSSYSAGASSNEEDEDPNRRGMSLVDPQPLNLSTRTPPPNNPLQHDISTEA